MQIAKLVQAVILLTIVALAASCAATKQYTSKIFPSNQSISNDSIAVALKFLDMENIEPNKESWVTTDIIMGRDTLSNTLALDNLATIYPAATIMNKDSSQKTNNNNERITTNTKKSMEPEEKVEKPIAKAMNQSGVREKSTREN